MNRFRNTLYFCLAVIVLAGSGAYLEHARRTGSIHIIKKALPLRKDLDALRRDCLLPYELVNARRLPAEVAGELGTDEYIEWTIRDAKAKKKWLRISDLSVTYYTGKQDLVPHVPEECYVQGAYSAVSGSEGDSTLDWTISSTGDSMAVRRLAFDPPHPTGKRVYVYYTIAINGEYHAGRTGVRIRMGDREDTHMYYSKIQVSFEDVPKDRLSELDKTAHALMDHVVGALIEDHFPLKEWARGGPTEEGAGHTDSEGGEG